MSLANQLKNHNQTIMYFYPKDDTPGCTIEAKDFSTYYNIFLKHNIGIVGISRDTEASHCDFIEKHGLTIPLISDTDLTLHKQFWTRGEKNNYGKIIQGVIRSTFLLDKSGNILKERRNVKATGHVEKIMKELNIK